MMNFACALLLSATPVLARPKYFGFWDTNLTELAGTINLQFELPPGAALNAAAARGVHSLLPHCTALPTLLQLQSTFPLCKCT